MYINNKHTNYIFNFINSNIPPLCHDFLHKMNEPNDKQRYYFDPHKKTTNAQLVSTLNLPLYIYNMHHMCTAGDIKEDEEHTCCFHVYMKPVLLVE